jgi:hypothetical protein
MRERVSHTLHSFLRGSAHAGGLSHRRDPNGQTSQRSSSHAKDIGVKVVCVKHIDSGGFQPLHKPRQLLDGVCIVEAVERERRNVAKIEILDRGT